MFAIISPEKGAVHDAGAAPPQTVNAIIAPEKGVALLLDQNELVGMVTPEGCVEKKAPLAFVATWMRELEEPIFLEDADAGFVQRALQRAVDADRAFRLFLPLFDLSMPIALREATGTEIERLFGQNGLLPHHTAARFYGAPFPAVERLESTLSLVADRPWPLLYEVLVNLWERQTVIREVCLAWAAIPADKFPYTMSAEEIRQAFVRRGLFYRLVDSLVCRASLPKFVEVEGQHPRLRHIPYLWFILRQWAEPFYLEQKEAYYAALEETRAEVARRKTSLLARVQGANLDVVEAEARDLIRFQLSRGARKYPAMSLCDLAIQAKGKGAFRAQKLFSWLAVETYPIDPQCWAQFADALKGNSQPGEALEIYEQLIHERPENAVAKNGCAEVLRDLNHLPEALAAYERTMAEHPEDAVAKNGRAEVLRDLNRLPEALAAYEQTMAEHPENAVAKNGCAEVLRDLNRLPEALAAYEQTMAEHPENAVAKNGCAEVLRDLNRLPEALAAYEQTMAEHPENAVAKNGCAEVLRDLNHLPEALAAYERTMAEHPEDTVAKNGRANILCKLGRGAEALEHLPAEPVQDVCNWIGFHMRGMIYLRQRRWIDAQRIFRLGCEAGLPVRQEARFRTALAICQLRLGNHREALNNLDVWSSRKFARTRSAIRAHALGAEGLLPECQAEIAIVRLYSFEMLQRIANEVEARYLYSAPQYSEDWLIDAETDLLLAT